MKPKTDTPRAERIADILLFLIRNRNRKFAVSDVLSHLNQSEPVIVRNVQRDLKMLSERHGEIVGAERKQGKLYYFIQPDMRDKLSLPIERNGLLALFLLKRLQSFFTSESDSLKALSDAAAEFSSQNDYDLFEDLDQRLEQSSFLMGERSVPGMDSQLFSDLITSLVERRRLEIIYRRPEGEESVKRTICPVKLVLYKSDLYFVCISEKHDDRNYYIKLCRIISAELLDSRFEVSDKRMQKIEKRLSGSFGILDADEPKLEQVEIEFPSSFDLILNERRFHPSQKISRRQNGNLVLRMKVPVDTELVQWVLGWGDKPKVVKPADLRRKLHEIGAFLVDAYGHRSN